MTSRSGMIRFALLVLFTLLFLGANNDQPTLPGADAEQPQIVVQMGHSGWVKSVAFSPDGKYAHSGSDDGTTRIWDAATGDWTAFMSNVDGSQWLTFTNGGSWDGSANCGELVAMVRDLDVWNIDQFAVRNNRPDIILQRLGSPNT